MTAASNSPRRLLAINATGQVSGAERVLIRVLDQARGEGWQVRCAAPDAELTLQLEELGIEHIELPELGLASGSKPVAVLRTLRAWAAAARTVRRNSAGADVVLVNSLMALPVIRLARPVPPVVWLAHDVVVRPDRLRLYKWCRPALARVVGVSEAVAARLRGGGVATDVVHNGVEWPVDPANEDVAGTEGGEVVVGLNGLMTSWKGQHVLLDAVSFLDPRVRVELMGGQLAKDGEYADRVRARAETEGGGRVAVLGHVADPLAQMRTWTIAVSASTDPEACPLNVLEAMSLGLPVVATDHGGSPEVLDGAGLLTPPGDAKALAAAISDFCHDDVLRSRKGAMGREKVANRHQRKVQSQVLLDLLDRTAQGSQEGRL